MKLRTTTRMLIEAPILVVRGKRECADRLVSSDTTDCPETAGLSYGLSGAGRNNELAERDELRRQANKKFQWQTAVNGERPSVLSSFCTHRLALSATRSFTVTTTTTPLAVAKGEPL